MCRVPEPGESGTATSHETAKKALVLCDVSTLGGAVVEPQHWRRGRCGPTQLCCNRWRDSNLDVQAAQRVLYIPDVWFDVDGRQQSGCRMVREEVDAAAVAEVIEADLGTD